MLNGIGNARKRNYFMTDYFTLFFRSSKFTSANAISGSVVHVQGSIHFFTLGGLEGAGVRVVVVNPVSTSRIEDTRLK